MVAAKHFIVVNVQDPEDTVFMAMPFAGFEELYTAIVTAASQVNLIAKRTDKNPQDMDFIADLSTQIRTARIVVAVCSPEQETDWPNPNVMYELGLAHSIGKSTIILTSKIDRLPSDLRNQNVLVYRPGDERQNSFIDRLVNWMNNAKGMVKEDGLTGKHYKDIYTAEPRHWMLLDPTSWNHLVTIHSFVKDVYNGFQLGLGSIAPVCGKAEEMFTTTSAAGAEWSKLIMENQSAWRKYVGEYNNIRDSFLDQMPDRQKKVDAAFSELQKADQRTIRALDRTTDWYNQMKSQLQSFDALHLEISNKADKGLLVEQFPSVQDFWYKINLLSQTISQVVTSSEKTIQNLAQVLLDGKEIR